MYYTADLRRKYGFGGIIRSRLNLGIRSPTGYAYT
jgi:hypothetical protein